ncbi:MAG: hypothetical protein IRZ33_06455, partial [Alicyclobacillaceae bacterium]|nr:hypothetical protein [Alicyclobacillaceae bacterium]
MKRRMPGPDADRRPAPHPAPRNPGARMQTEDRNAAEAGRDSWEARLRDELERMPNRFTPARQAEILQKAAGLPATSPAGRGAGPGRRWLGPVAAALAGVAMCGFALFRVVDHASHP